MKIGIISDIHSNIYAFKACTEYMEKQKCDEYFFLGDYISDTPYTRETMDYLYEFMENHEKLSDTLYRTTYSDGTTVTVDYDALSYTVKKPDGTVIEKVLK